MHRLTPIALAVTALASACANPATTFTVQGKVESALTVDETTALTSSGTKAAVVWIAGSIEGTFPVADVVDVNGALPSNFTLTMREPEAASFIAMQTDKVSGELESLGDIAIGFIVALPADAAVGDQVDLDGLIGVSQQHMVIYAPTEASAEAFAVFADASYRDLHEGFNIIDMALTSDAYTSCRADAVAAIDACHANCNETCDPDSAEDPGCDICRTPCSTTLTDEFHACDELIHRVVADDTLLSVTLDPDLVSSSPVWSVGAQQDTSDEGGADEPIDTPADPEET